MDNSFVNRRDKIIDSAIEIISEAGIESLTTKNLAMKQNMSESLLYRYFGGIDEVLVEVIETFTKFDNSIIATVAAKNISHMDRVLELLDTLLTYYNGYCAIAAIALNYEYFLHNVSTRDRIAACIKKRSQFLHDEIAAAIESGEIVDTFTAGELVTIFLGTADRELLNQRIYYENINHNQVTRSVMEKIADSLRIKPVRNEKPY